MQALEAIERAKSKGCSEARLDFEPYCEDMYNDRQSFFEAVKELEKLGFTCERYIYFGQFADICTIVKLSNIRTIVKLED